MTGMSWKTVALGTSCAGLLFLALVYAVGWKLDESGAEYEFRVGIMEPINWARYERHQNGPIGQLGRVITSRERVELFLKPARHTAAVWQLAGVAMWLDDQIAKIESGQIRYPERDGRSVMRTAHAEFAPQLRDQARKIQWSVVTALCLAPILLLSIAIDRRRGRILACPVTA